MARRTKDDAEKTRDSILNAAEKVFYKHGVASSSLEDVAQAAKVTRGAVYWHFRDKFELCDAMLNRALLPQEDILERLSVNQSSTLADLSKACIDSLKSMATDKRRFRVFTIMLFRCEYVEEMAQAIARRRECKDLMHTRFVRLFERAAQNDELAVPWTPLLAAISLQSLMVGLIMSMVEGRNNFDPAKTGVKCLKVFFTTLQKN